MLYKAIKSFGGIITMTVGDTKEIADVNIAQDLLKAGYIAEMKPAEKGKTETKTTAKTTRKKRG